MLLEIFLLTDTDNEPKTLNKTTILDKKMDPLS